jgi:hypothetical protein
MRHIEPIDEWPNYSRALRRYGVASCLKNQFGSALHRLCQQQLEFLHPNHISLPSEVVPCDHAHGVDLYLELG